MILSTLAVTFASVSTLITIASTESAYASAVGVDFHSRITILFASSYTIRMHRKTINPHLLFFALFRSKKKYHAIIGEYKYRKDCRILWRHNSVVRDRTLASLLERWNQLKVFASLEWCPVLHEFLNPLERRFCSWNFSSQGYPLFHLLAWLVC